MGELPVELHPEAEEEYLSSLAWYLERSLSAAENFERAFDRAIQEISDGSEPWPVYFSRFRKYTLRQFPFIIVYRKEPSRVFVLAVAHGRRRPGYWKGRV